MKSASECADSGGCRKQQAVAERTGTKLIPHWSTTAAVGLVGSRLGETSYVQRLSESFDQQHQTPKVNQESILGPSVGPHSVLTLSYHALGAALWGGSGAGAKFELKFDFVTVVVVLDLVHELTYQRQPATAFA